MPMKKQYEKYGVSLDSFAYCTTLYNTKYEALFKAVYGKGGSKEVSDADLTKYFKENYTDYSYLSVNLYTSTKDEAGSSKNVAMSDKEIKKVEDQLNGYKNDLNKGGSFDDVIASYKKSSGSGTDSSVSNVEVLDKSSIGDELKRLSASLKQARLKLSRSAAATAQSTISFIRKMSTRMLTAISATNQTEPVYLRQ